VEWNRLRIEPVWVAQKVINFGPRKYELLSDLAIFIFRRHIPDVLLNSIDK